VKGVALLMIALALPAWIGEWWRETNSYAANARGVKAWAKNEYAAAAAAFARAQDAAPSPASAFNLGTAEIAAGKREEGSSHLEEAIRDPRLRADALFNRGNSALAAKALDHAVSDYIGALKADPSHAGAKRNLEIALRRRESERRSSSGQKSQQGQSQGEQKPAPADGKEQQRGEMDLQSLLRSVQQQEQEELRRMKGQAGEGRVGW
jgi:Ca-activated chloride channel family protein